MSTKELNQIAPEDIFNIIVSAGEGKSYLYEAFNMVKNGQCEESKEFIEKADEALNKAHKYQTQLITLEAQGVKTEAGILMVHAQDHLMNAILAKELISNMISMQEEINQLKNKLGGK